MKQKWITRLYFVAAALFALAGLLGGGAIDYVLACCFFVFGVVYVRKGR